MTNWNKCLTELRAKYGEKPLTDKELFESPEYREFTQRAAEDMVNGICGYLRRQGFHITEAQEDERVRSIKMNVHYAEDDATTAFTDGEYIGINAGNKMLAPLKSPELRHFAVQGFRVHEIGHVIFSDFPTTKAWLDQLKNGEWWPAAPKGITTESGAALAKKLKQEYYYRQVLLQVAKGVENALEDGYIEREIQSLYGGLATTELSTLNDMLLEDMKSFGEQLADGVKPFFAMLNQLLLYAKFDMTMAEGCPDEYLPMLEECIFTIDEVKLERDPQKRVAGVNEILCILFPLLDETVQDMQKSQPQQQQGQNGQPGKPGQQGQQGQQSQNGKPGQSAPMTQAQSDALVADAKEAAKKAGGTAAPSNRTTTSLANPGKRENANAVAKTAAEKAGPHNQIAQTPGASIGDSDLSAGQWELDKIQQQAADARAKQAVEWEMKREMQEEASAILQGAVSVDRAADVDHEVQAQVNLVDFSINIIVDDVLVRSEQYDDLGDLVKNGLSDLDFNVLMYVPDEELAALEKEQQQG